MKPNEIMVGDWVQTKEVCTKDYCLPSFKRQVAQINDNCVELSYIDRYGNKCYITLLYDDIVPIPLTEEILESNGFVRHDKHEYSVTGSNDNYLKVRCFADTYFEIGNAFDEEGELQAFADIQYVHELQHALKLCGMNKTIEL